MEPTLEGELEPVDEYPRDLARLSWTDDGVTLVCRRRACMVRIPSRTRIVGRAETSALYWWTTELPYLASLERAAAAAREHNATHDAEPRRSPFDRLLDAADAITGPRGSMHARRLRPGRLLPDMRDRARRRRRSSGGEAVTLDDNLGRVGFAWHCACGAGSAELTDEPTAAAAFLAHRASACPNGLTTSGKPEGEAGDPAGMEPAGPRPPAGSTPDLARARAIRAVVDAVRSEGPHPGYHRAKLLELRRTWPTLWEAVTDLAYVSRRS